MQETCYVLNFYGAVRHCGETMEKRRMKKVVIANQKGGAGKSTTAYNFGRYLSELRNQRVLFIDADTQAHSSLSLRQNKTNLAASQFFGTAPLKLTGSPGELVLAYGDNAGLLKVEAMVNDQEAVLGNLKKRLADVESDFDWCVFDTPGSNSIVVGAALYVADYVFIPTEIDQYNLDVTVTMLKRIIGLQKTHNPGLVNLGVLANKFDAGKPSQKRDLETFLQKFNQFVIRAKLTNKSVYRDAAAEGVPVWKMKSTSAREAGKEIKAAFDLIAEKMGVQ